MSLFFLLDMTYLMYSVGRTTVHVVLSFWRHFCLVTISAQKASWFESQPGPFYVEFACPFVCVGSLWLSPAILKTCQVNWRL